MRRNPFLKADRIVISKLYGNTAVLTYRVRVRSYDAAAGEFAETEFPFVRTVHISEPSEVSEGIVDGKNYLKGDLTAEIAYLELKQSLDAQPGDPAVTVGGEPKTLAELRPMTVMKSGIDTRLDTLEYGGTVYRFVKVKPKHVYANTASIFRLQLREGTE
nr:MAG TPA: hypothetical protein [Caudoviricetes sp.]